MTFDPGPAWREVPRPVAAVAPEAVSHRQNHVVRTWVPVDWYPTGHDQ